MEVQTEILQHNEHTEYHIIEIICYPFYITLLCILTILISFNKRKFRKRYHIDEIFLFCAVYIFNVLVTWNFFDFIPKLGRFIITLVLIFTLQYYFGRFQIVGITGGIGCGKSTISKYFSDFLKLSVVDCDQLSRRIMEPGKPAYNQVIERFGTGILVDGKLLNEIDRKVLGEIVFNSKTKRQLLTSITNKYIFIEILKEIWICCFRKKNQYIVIEAPILFESKILPYFCYPIITVYIKDQNEQIKRICLRDGLTNDQALQRIQSQMPMSKKIELSDIAISNDKEEKNLINELQKKVFDYLI